MQARVQAELDSVVPRGRPPSLDDKASLPYTDAVLLELLRMRSVTPFTSRLTLCDTQVAGYSIPVDTGVGPFKRVFALLICTTHLQYSSTQIIFVIYD